jgi:hypothetical protein
VIHVAKKTTTKTAPSRRKKTPTKVEEAEVVEETLEVAPDAEADTEKDAGTPVENEAATVEDTVEVAESTDDDALQAEPEATDEPDPSTDAGSSEDPEAPVDESDLLSDDADTDENKDDAQQVATEDAPDTDVNPVEVEPQPVAEPTPSVAPEPAKASPFPLVVGGVVAGAIGFFAAYLTGSMNQGPDTPPIDVSGIEASIAHQGSRIEELAAQIPEPQNVPDVSALEESVADMSNAIAGLRNDMSDLQDRVATLAEAPPAAETSGNVAPEVLDDLEALQTALAAQEAEIAAMQAETEAARQAAQFAAADTLKRAAMTRINTALDTGTPFADALLELQQLGVTTPETLSQFQTAGVTSLSALQETFPEAARAALTASRSEASEAGETGGFTGFLRSQLGARSLTPQEGSGTDAVLSRAEAALRDGRVADALAEIETLPEAARPAMSQWASTAKQRADALAAAQDLSDSLN